MSAPNRQDNPKSFASELVSDPDAVPSLRVLWGFIGDTSRPKHVRLYANLELSQYYDVPEEAIRGRRDVAKEDPLAGTYL